MTSEYELPEDCGYNKVYHNQWRTGQYGIGMGTIQKISKTYNQGGKKVEVLYQLSETQ